MITLKHTPLISMSTVHKYIYRLGIATAIALALLALYALLWLIEEVFYAIDEILRLLSIANPLVITSALIVLAVWLIGKVKK